MSNPLDKSTPRNVVFILGFFVILKSLDGLFFIISYKKYSAIFNWLATETIQRRYFFSWLFRIVSLACGIGILFRKELFRRLTMGWSMAAILCTFWKHPYQAFANVYLYYGLDVAAVCRQLERSGFPALSPEQLLGGSMIAARVADIIIYAGFIYFLSRKTIKAHFR